MPTKKTTAISRAQLKNIIKITIGDRKKRKSRRKKARRTRQADQMDLLTALASKPMMREIKQDKDADREQNKLITSSLIASNAGVIQALNNLNVPSYTTGYAPPPFYQNAARNEEEQAPPETPAGKYAEKVRLARQFLMNNLSHIPTKRTYTAGEILDLAPTYVMNLATRTRKNIDPTGVEGLFIGDGEDDESV